ncbi:Retrovirus-related Pol polyprotein from transposon 17.6 [Vitis vinifera]|uniref:Retrovirus-related Pol polyprotein from transposon 17.6 n=1 Tax=Vitis vinifera TaxID=29760 RepID=A0A438G5L8_VITVI|nr:Retrovirus-related Pol polyprotein from transposon 17.6 [Vitis vinifera]
MARLRKERVRARLSHTPFDYPIRPYRMSLADYFVRGSENRPRVEEVHSVVHTDREIELQHLFHQLQLSNGVHGASISMATSTSPDQASMLSLCFSEEITDDGVIVDPTEMVDGVVPHDEYQDEMNRMTVSQITGIVQLQPVSPFDMFGVSTIEVLEETQIIPVPELLEDDSSLFEGTVSPVEGASDLVDPPLSFDILSGFVSRSDDVSVASFMDLNDEVAWPDPDRDSSDHDSDPVDERVSPATGDFETVDFGTEDQPREDMSGLDPSIVQHHLPILPHARPVKQKLRRLHPHWSLQVKEEIQKQLSVGFISVVEYPKWLANVVLVPKKDGKVRVWYNQILMAPEDKEKTAFITEWGTYYYKVMPFGLKNAGATYQRATTTLFHDMMHRDVEVYVDDMIVKSQGRADHLEALERFFERIQEFRLRLNPKKCTFGVTSGKLLGHMVSERGIEVDPDKIKAILDMPAPKTEKEIRGFLGRLQYISRFIARLTDILPPTPGRPLLLYLSVSDMTLGCMLAQIDDSGKERAIYYLSKRMLEYEVKYVMIERFCLALVWATRRLRHYMTEYSVHLISRLDPLRYLFDRPALTGRLMRWLVLLTEFDIQYVSQKSVKGSIVADHLASLPISDSRLVDDDFPDEEFIAMTSLSGWRMSVRLAFSDRHPATNNIVEYEACILGLETALELDIRQMEVFGDSNLSTEPVCRRFSYPSFFYGYSIDVVIRPLLIELRSAPSYCCLIGETEIQDDLPWYHDIYQLLRFGTYLEVATAKDRRALRNLATRFVICGDTLYRRSADGMLLLCLDQASTDRVMREVHVGVCGSHMGGHMLARKIMRTGYFWLTMETDCCQFVQKCPECQIHGDLIHAPPSELHALTSPWPFSVWGIDIIGKVSPKSSSGHEFILAAIDYFTKWVEATSYARLTSAKVASFIRSHIICRYGVPHELISDRGVHIRAEVDTLLQKYGIRHHRSSAYRPQTNEVVEAANKNIKRILRKMVETSRDWSEKLLFALWAYRTSFRTSTGATPYSLVYGMEAVLPVETEMGSLRLALEQQILRQSGLRLSLTSLTF